MTHRTLALALALSLLATPLSACKGTGGPRPSVAHAQTLVAMNDAVPDAGTAAAVRARSPVVRRATMGSVGDVLPHLMVKGAARARARRNTDGSDANHRGYDDVMGALGVTIPRYDIATFNMEAPVADENLLAHMRLRFHADPPMPKALSKVGFDIAVCANNHAFDQGNDGVEQSVRNLHAAGLRTVGCGPNFDAAAEPVIVEVNGIRIAILSFARILNAYNPARRERPQDPQVLFWYPEDPVGREVLDVVRRTRARADVDILVVNAHWDREYVPTPHSTTRALARVLVDEGVDLIVGHHPHILQPAEWMMGPNGRRSAVIYSLGNFVSEMCASRQPLDLCDRRLSAISVATFEKRGDEPARLAELTFEPAWMDHRALCPGETEARTGCVRPVVVGEEITRLEQALAVAGANPPEALVREHRGFILRRDAITRFMGPHPEGQSPSSPYIGVDPTVVSNSVHGPRRPFRD